MQAHNLAELALRDHGQYKDLHLVMAPSVTIENS